MFSSKRDIYSSWSARCGYCDQKRHTRYRVKLNYMHGCRERMQRTDAPVKNTRFKLARSHYREVVTERKGRTTWVLLLLLLLLLLYDSLKNKKKKKRQWADQSADTRWTLSRLLVNIVPSLWLTNSPAKLLILNDYVTAWLTCLTD